MAHLQRLSSLVKHTTQDKQNNFEFIAGLAADGGNTLTHKKKWSSDSPVVKIYFKEPDNSPTSSHQDKMGKNK